MYVEEDTVEVVRPLPAGDVEVTRKVFNPELDGVLALGYAPLS